MLQFDERDYLIPDQVLRCTLPEFRLVFVESVQDEGRSLIFKNFLQFCGELLHDLDLPNIKIWANGSFTTRKRNPNDLDGVLFIDVEIVEKHRQLLKARYRNDFLQKEKQLDLYFVETYPENHPKRFLMQSDMAYWIEKFTRTRPD